MRRLGIVASAIVLGVRAGASMAALAPGGTATCTGPIKKILLIKRKPGTTHEQFRDYYENRHAQLALRLLGNFMLDYRRNYLQPADETTAVPGRPQPDYDVVTELWFKNRADMEAMYAYVRQPEIGSQIAADEEKFMDRPANRQVTVDECKTPN